VVDHNLRMLSLRVPDVSVRWLPASAAALLWALAAGAVVLWWLHLPQSGRDEGMSISVAPVAPAAQDSGHVLRVLGHTAVTTASPQAQQRFQLLGVIAADSGQGSALLRVDGQPPQAFVQGQTVAEGWRLHSVDQMGVRLSAGAGGAMLELALP